MAGVLIPIPLYGAKSRKNSRENPILKNVVAQEMDFFAFGPCLLMALLAQEGHWLSFSGVILCWILGI